MKTTLDISLLILNRLASCAWRSFIYSPYLLQEAALEALWHSLPWPDILQVWFDRYENEGHRGLVRCFKTVKNLDRSPCRAEEI